MVITFEELDKVKTQVNCMMYLIIAKPNSSYKANFIYPCLEFKKSDKTEKYIQYGYNARSLYKYFGESEKDAYKWFYNMNVGLFDYSKVDNVYGQLLESSSIMYLERYNKLHNSFAEISKKNNKPFKSTDIKPISFGVVNMVYDISKVEPDSIMRFMMYLKHPFDENGCKILSELKDSGFVKVHYYNSNGPYSVLDKCEPIVEFDKEKWRLMLDKIRKTLIKNPSLSLADYHRGNVMQKDGEYVFVDIDLNMVNADYFIKKGGIKDIKTLIDTTVPTTAHFCSSIPTVLNYGKLPITNTSISLCSLELSHIAGGERTIKFSQEVCDELVKRVKTDLEKIV